MTRFHLFSAWARALALVTLLAGTSAHGQPLPDVDDPPVRVGRMSFVSGDVSFAAAGSDEWVQAQINRPIVTGDQVWSDANARVELSIDNSAWWLGSATSVTVSNLDDRIAQFQLQQGTLEFRVRRLPPGNIVEVDTPNLAFSVTRAGRYRVVVDPQDGATTVTVRSGSADVYGEGASYAVATGQSYRFYGTDLRDSELASLPPPDRFDRFVTERAQRYDRNVSVRYVSAEVVGYEDLDTYGAWSVDSNYGNVWFPRTVQAGWAPYRDGHWSWIDPWGWTWVDDQPWGFAPFHYGRWAHFDRGWGWVPGPRTVRPVYAPALVAFVGGSGFSISVSSGPAIGWFPLGPREVYRPPYRVSSDYFRQVNVSNTVINQVNITNVYNNYRTNTNVVQTNYVNMRAPNAVTAVPPAAFAQSQNVSRAAVALPAAAIAAAQVQSVARGAPARQALVGAAPATRARPPAAVLQRAVVARSAPPPAPVPDAQKLQALEKNPGQPLSTREMQQLRAAGSVQARPVKVVEQAKPAPVAAPPARPAGEGAARRAQSGGGVAPGATPAAGSPAAVQRELSRGSAAAAPAEGSTATPAGARPPQPAATGRDPRNAAGRSETAPGAAQGNPPPAPDARQLQQERANPGRGAPGAPPQESAQQRQQQQQEAARQQQEAARQQQQRTQQEGSQQQRARQEAAQQRQQQQRGQQEAAQQQQQRAQQEAAQQQQQQRAQQEAAQQRQQQRGQQEAAQQQQQRAQQEAAQRQQQQRSQEAAQQQQQQRAQQEAAQRQQQQQRAQQ